jgi:hypothetical protein
MLFSRQRIKASGKLKLKAIWQVTLGQLKIRGLLPLDFSKLEES